MADLTTDFLGIKSPNPFWLASAPPTDKAYNVNRAFEAGWGGVVWKTLGEDPPLATNLAEIRHIKRDWPGRALVVSVMLPMNEQSWAKYVPMVEDTGADGLE